MEIKKNLEINKWNVYLANVPFLDIKGQKARPVIVIAKIDIAVFIVPLTTNLDKTNKYDIPIKLNNQKGLIKVESLQRIYIKNFIKPLYSIKTKVSNKLSDFNNLNKINKTDTKEVINTLTSFKDTKEFKKRDWKQVLPPMTCHKILVEKFKIEAKEKKWKYTTLMNEILEARYGKVED